MKITHSKNPNRYQRHAGVATILVISSLLVLTLIGFALITIVTYQRMAAGSASVISARDEAQQISVQALKLRLQKDLVDSYRAVDATDTASTDPTADYAARGVTYPSAHQNFLASTEPQGAGASPNTDFSTFSLWPRISKLGKPTDTYVNITDLSTLDASQDNFTFQAITTANSNLYADPDGSGFASARWELFSNIAANLGITAPPNDGLTWVQATRIIDNSGLIDLNTTGASFNNSTTNPGPATPSSSATAVAFAYPTGRTPADVCLYYPLSQTDGAAATWSGTGFTVANFLPTTTSTDNGSVNWKAFYQIKGNGSIPGTVVDRKGFWDVYASKQNQLFPIGTAAPLATGNPVGFADEVELRFKAYKNLDSRSFLESTLDTDHSTNAPNRSNSGPFRSYFAETDTINATQAKADRRRLFTVFNGTNTIPVPTALTNAGSTQYREPMPLWLSDINVGTSAPVVSGFTYPQGVPSFKLNPNTDNATWLGYVFENILKQNAYLAARHGGDSSRPDYPQAEDAAYMLAANLARYRLMNGAIPFSVSDTQTYAPNQAQVDSPTATPKTYYGLAIQPFMTEVVYSEVYKDPGDDGKLVDATELPTGTGNTTPVARYVAVELRNPWPVNIDLTRFSLQYNGASVTLTGILAPGDYVVVHSSDAVWSGMLTANTTTAGKLLPVNTTPLLPLGTLGNGVFEIIENSTTIVVDRMQKDLTATTAWMRPAAPSDPGAYPYNLPSGGAAVPTPAYYFYWTFATLQRSWTYDNTNFPTANNATPPATIGFAQSYMMENSAGNATTVFSNNANFGSNPSNTWRLVTGTGAAAYPVDPDIATSLAVSMGNTNPTDYTTALPKTGTLPTGLTWPKFQVAMKYDSSTSPNTVGGLLTTVGEVLNLLTVSHTSTKTFAENLADRYLQVASAPNNPVILNQPPILNYGQFSGGRFSVGAGTTDVAIRSLPPHLPLALCIPSTLDILVNDSTSNPSFLAGRININTAPPDVMEAMPHFYRYSRNWGGLPTNYYIARGVVAYRDLLTVSSGPDYAGTLSDANNRAVWTGVQTSPVSATANRNLRLDKGFATAEELLMVRTTSGAPEYAINYLGGDGVNTPAAATGPFDFTVDQLIDDTEEDSMVYNMVSNIASSRSDVFTAYVTLKGLKPITPTSGSNYESKVTRRYVATVLRGSILLAGSDGNLVSTTSLSVPSATAANITKYIGKTVLLRKRTGSTAASPTQTLAAIVTGASGTTLTISIYPGLYSGAPSLTTGWEYQIIDDPKILSFVETKPTN